PTISGPRQSPGIIVIQSFITPFYRLRSARPMVRVGASVIAIVVWFTQNIGMKHFATSVVVLAVSVCVGGQVNKGPVVDISVGTGQVTVPFRSADNLVIVEARVNGSGPGWFIFDTGAERTVIDAEFAAAAGLKRSGTSVGTGW